MTRTMKPKNLWLLLIPAAVFYALEGFTHDPWTTMYPKVQLWNILFYELIFALLFLLLGRIRLSLILGTLLFTLLGTVNCYVMEFRSAPLVPWDFLSLVTAASVADNYDYTPTLRTLLVWGAFLVILAVIWFSRPKLKAPSPRLRLSLLALCLCLLGGYVGLVSTDGFVNALKLDNTLFTPHVMARKNGLCVSFLMDLRYMMVSEPEDYQRDRVEMMLKENNTQDDAACPDPDELPNIIVIMDEAFSDPAILADFETNRDYLPFLHEVMEDADPRTHTGWLNVSVKGGNTANTEFEFLTGGTMRFLPGGCVPYQQYIFDARDTLVSHLKSLGYSTAAMHPFNSTGWNRDKVYRYFGFDRILFNSSFFQPLRIRKYISDEACFDKILELTEAQSSRAPLFVFAVTMQNHSGYTEDFDNFTPDITVTDAPEGLSTRLLQKYLSLMKISDAQLQRLLRELNQSGRKNLVLFFGDHQPNDVVVESIWKMNGTASSRLTPEQQVLRYKVPYLIWSDYDLPEEPDGSETSANYLAARLLRLAGIPLAPWMEQELAVGDEIPVLTTETILRRDGSTADPQDPELAPLLRRYEQIQYYKLFDEEVLPE